MYMDLFLVAIKVGNETDVFILLTLNITVRIYFSHEKLYFFRKVQKCRFLLIVEVYQYANLMHRQHLLLVGRERFGSNVVAGNAL